MRAVYHLAGKGKPKIIKHYVDNQCDATLLSTTTTNTNDNQNKPMKYTPIKCQNCGAPLTRQVNGDIICKYCDTVYSL